MSAGLIVIGAMVGLVCFLLLASVLNVHTEAEERIRGFAASLRGRFVWGGLLEFPSIHLSIRGRDAWMRFFTGNYPSTTLEVRLPGPSDGLLRITPDSMGKSWLRFIGVQEVEIGDPSFDALYFVESLPESLARRVFAPERREEAIAAVRRLGACPDFTLTVQKELLRIHVGEVVRDVPVILALEKTASDFVGFLTDEAVPALQFEECLTGRCPICTTVLREPLVRCRRCRAQHHQECWDYAGRCATYGCEPRPGRRAA